MRHKDMRLKVEVADGEAQMGQVVWFVREGEAVHGRLADLHGNYLEVGWWGQGYDLLPSQVFLKEKSALDALVKYLEVRVAEARQELQGAERRRDEALLKLAGWVP